MPAPLVREWVRSQAAGGYLDYQPATDRYVLPEPVAVALLDAPGGAMIGACTEMFESMLASYDDLAAAFTDDGSFGWHQRDLRHWHGTDRLTRAQLPADLIGAAVAAMPGIADALDAGGRVLDVGCGFGFPTTAIAERFPRASVVGVDYHQDSVDEARRTADAAGVGDRVDVHRGGGDRPAGLELRPGHASSTRCTTSVSRSPHCGPPGTCWRPAGRCWCATTTRLSGSSTT